MQAYTLTTPTQAGSLGQLSTISSLVISAVAVSVVGQGSMTVTVTDTKSGYTENFSFSGIGVQQFLQSAAVAPQSGDQFIDTVGRAIFSMLSAVGRIPAGTVGPVG